MNKRIVWGFLFVSLFCISVIFCAHAVSADSTDGIFFDSGVYLLCPVNQTYNCNHIPLYLTFDGVGGGIDYNLTYNLDDMYSGPIPLVMNGPATHAPLHFLSEYIGSVNLPQLSNGEHHLTIYVVANVYHANAGGAFKPKISSDGTVYYSASYADTVNFYIDAAPSPNNASPRNETHTTDIIHLNQTADFSKSSPTPTPSPPAETSPTTPIIVAIVVLVTVDSGLGILAYLKKRKIV